MDSRAMHAASEPASNDHAALARQKALRTWAGRGSGEEMCDRCKHEIRAGEVEYEVELGTSGVVKVLYFHWVCHQRSLAESSRTPR